MKLNQERVVLKRVIYVVLLVALFCVACGDGGSNADPTPTATVVDDTILIADGDPIVIGVAAAAATGQSLAGQDLVDAVILAAEDAGGTIAGHALTIESALAACADPEGAVAAARTLIEDRSAVGVIGPMCATSAQAANDEYEEAGIPHITPSVSRADLSALGSRFFFRTAWRDDDQARVQATFARETLRATTAVVVDDGQPYGRTLADGFIEAFEEAGGRISSRERIRRGETDFDPLATAIRTSDPDVVVFEGLYPEGAFLLRDLREGGFDGTFMGPDSLFTAQDFIQTAVDADGAILTAGPRPDAAFTERFRSRFGREPSTSFVLQTYDAARILFTALGAVSSEASGGTQFSRAAILEAIRAERFDGLSGPIEFGESGDRSGLGAASVGLAVYRVEGSDFVRVE